MSLLDKWNYVVTVFPEEEFVSRDGNLGIRASSTGVEKRAMIQPLPQSGTSQRRAEQDNEGYESEEMYRLRFARADEMNLGMASQVLWDGYRWSINGKATRYNGSSRTRHLDYLIKRA